MSPASTTCWEQWSRAPPRRASTSGRATSKPWPRSRKPRSIIMRRFARCPASGARRKSATSSRTCRTPALAAMRPRPTRWRTPSRSDPGLLILGGLPDMIRRCGVVGALCVGLLLLAPPRPATAQDARAFVGTLGQQAIQVLGPSAAPAQRLARFRELFHNDFDVPGIGQFVLGRYWRTATPEEQQEFLGLFQEYIVRAYSARLAEYAGEPFRVTGSRPNGEETVVNSQIVRGNGTPIAVAWYLIGGAAGAPRTA